MQTNRRSELGRRQFLRTLGVYQLNAEDIFRDQAFDHLLEIEPFVHVRRPPSGGDEEFDPFDTWSQWEEVMLDLRMRHVEAVFLRLEEEREAGPTGQAPADPTVPESQPLSGRER